MLALDYFGLSDIGKVRSKNEDFWTADPEGGLFVVADGLGGRTAGEVASKEAVLKWISLFEEARSSFFFRNADEYVDLLTEILCRVNEWVYVKGVSDNRLTGMGTTLSSISFMNDRVFLSHVGDSRIYRVRGNRMEQLTQDHSLAMKRYNEGYSGLSDLLPYKHILTNVIGINPYLNPDVYHVSYLKNDVFCLCSDGLSNAIDEREMTDVLFSDRSLEVKSNHLVELANMRGGKDNITVLLVEVF
ncbi:MAG: protein phosphatase 2C domain-containing protein [Victivallaceae bacterium]